MTSVHRAEDVRILAKECQSLAAAGYDTHLVVTGDRNRRVGLVNIHSAPRPSGGRLARALLATYRIYQVSRALRARIYHIHDPELLPVAVLLRRAGAAVVYDAHEDLPRDIESKDWVPRRLRRPLAIAAGLVEVFFARRVSAVVAATPTICDRFKALGCNAIAVRNMPLLDEFSQPPREACVEGENSYVGYVGGISAIRGSRVMIEAVARSGVKLALAGPMTVAEQAALACLSGWSRVRYLGELDRPGVVNMLRDCFAGLVVLQPTRAYRESLPVKMFEYMAAGIPVIASDFEPWRRLINEFNCGICVDPTDPVAVANAIRELADDKGRARDMGLRGRMAVTRHLNWAPEASKLLDLYRTLAGDPSEAHHPPTASAPHGARAI
jgi:glycosyltransferase involved in cell wall biosynthesis